MQKGELDTLPVQILHCFLYLLWLYGIFQSESLIVCTCVEKCPFICVPFFLLRRIVREQARELSDSKLDELSKASTQGYRYYLVISHIKVCTLEELEIQTFSWSQWPTGLFLCQASRALTALSDSRVWSHERIEEQRHVVLMVMVFHVIYQIYFSMGLCFDTTEPLETKINYSRRFLRYSIVYLTCEKAQIYQLASSYIPWQ